MGRLNDCYDEVISFLRNAESIMIRDPGEANDDLNKRIERDNPHGREIDVATIDKMTGRQIIAKVRERLLNQSRSSSPKLSARRHAMALKILRFATILLVALLSGLAFAHLLEQPAKMQYDAALYITLQKSL